MLAAILALNITEYPHTARKSDNLEVRLFGQSLDNRLPNTSRRTGDSNNRHSGYQRAKILINVVHLGTDQGNELGPPSLLCITPLIYHMFTRDAFNHLGKDWVPRFLTSYMFIHMHLVREWASERAEKRAPSFRAQIYVVLVDLQGLISSRLS